MKTATRCRLIHFLPLGFAVLPLLTPATTRADDLDQWRECLQRSAAKMEDQVSDARSIAAGAYAVCRPERLRGVGERARHLSPKPGEIENAVDGQRESDIDYATII